MTPFPDPDFTHPLIGRQRRLITALRVSGVVSFALALVGLVLPGQVGDVAARAFVGALVLVPLGRVMWLTIRWVRRGDLRFAAVAGGVLLVAMGAVASAV